MNKVLMSNILLIIAAFIWGANGIFQKIAASDIGPFTFMSIRTLLGSMVLLIICAYFEKKESGKLAIANIKGKYDRNYIKRLLYCAPFCGVVNVLGSVLVQIGLEYTTAIKTAFITSTYIVFVPILGILFFKNKISKNAVLGVVLATVGLYFLCMKESLTIEKYDIIILGSTMMFALHIQLIGKYVHEFVGVHFSFVEFAFASLVCGVIALIIEEPTMEQISMCWMSLAFTGIFGIGVCYAMQVTAQKYTDPTIAALLMSLEAVFSAILGVLILGESITSKEMIGVAFIFVAVMLSQIPAKAKKG